MDDLATFIEARLADLEIKADGLHEVETCPSLGRDGDFEPRWCECGYPAMVARGVAAKRLMVKLHNRVHECPVIVPVPDPSAFAEGMYISTEYVDPDEPTARDVTPCTTLRAIAMAWSDHPDYRAEWAPSAA